MPGPILVPLDGSSVAARALTYAVAVARERPVPLLLVRVLEPTPSRGMPLVQEPDAQSYLERIAGRLRDEGIDIHTLVCSTMFGTVPEVLVSKAQQRGCGLIVMSTHGRSGLGRWVYGTVAEEVLRSPDDHRCRPSDPLNVRQLAAGQAAARVASARRVALV